jgi:hypothetical protein
MSSIVDQVLGSSRLKETEGTLSLVTSPHTYHFDVDGETGLACFCVTTVDYPVRVAAQLLQSFRSELTTQSIKIKSHGRHDRSQHGDTIGGVDGGKDSEANSDIHSKCIGIYESLVQQFSNPNVVDKLSDLKNEVGLQCILSLLE